MAGSEVIATNGYKMFHASNRSGFILRFSLTFMVGLLSMAAFAGTLSLPIQLVGALLTGLTVGWLTDGLLKAIVGSFLSVLLGTVLAGVIWGLLTRLGLAGITIGLGVGGIYGIGFGVIAVVASLAAGLIQHFRRRRAG